MSSFPEQNDPPHNSKKIPLICSKFRFSDYISIIDFYVSTVRIRLPDRKVLFDSFVKRKLRLPMSRGHVLFLEFFRIYSIKKCVMFTKLTTLVSCYWCNYGIFLPKLYAPRFRHPCNMEINFPPKGHIK